MAKVTGLTSSAAALLSMLKETNPVLQIDALSKLNHIVDIAWPEISGSLTTIVSFSNEQEFEGKELAALLASKVLFHLDKLHESMSYALRAGSLFEACEESEYGQAISDGVFNKYITLKNKAAHDDSVGINFRLQVFVDRVLDRWILNGEYKLAFEMAIECKLIYKLEEAIRKSGNIRANLDYCFEVCHSFINDKKFRNEVLKLLVKLYHRQSSPDYWTISQCLLILNQHEEVAIILERLIGSMNVSSELLAFQIAFSVVESNNHSFLSKLLARLDHSDTMAKVETKMKIKNILAGDIPLAFTLEFLCCNDKSDISIFQMINQTVGATDSVCHMASLCSNAIMHAGTSVDTSFKKNWDLLKTLSEWYKFTGTAGFGVIYKGNLLSGRYTLGTHLPQGGTDFFIDGGRLYAYGFIFSGQGHRIKEFFLDCLNYTKHEAIQFGICLGIGLASLGHTDVDLFENIEDILREDRAVSGEAAGICLGLLMAGTGDDKAIQTVLSYANATEHDKTIRGITTGVALMACGMENKVDALVEKMTQYRNPIFRCGGMLALALAYRGTASKKAIRQLLHFAASDKSDDVKRTSVLALGFVLYSEPEEAAKIISLLSDSHDDHIRYGAALALGISCAGTGLFQAVSLLEKLTRDNVDFVRQGGFISMAMVLVQANEGLNSQVGAFRQQLRRTIIDEHEAIMSKMGAILGYGILEAGGRNVNFSFSSKMKHDKLNSVIGLAVFSQYWFNHTFFHFISLALSPTAFIGVDYEMSVPDFEFQSLTCPSRFDYPKLPPTSLAKPEPIPLPAPVILSTTERRKFRGINKPAEQEPSPVKVEKEQQSTFTILTNPTRVLPAQEKFIRFLPNSRYLPVTPLQSGFVVLEDRHPHKPKDFSPAVKDVSKDSSTETITKVKVQEC